MAGDTKGQPPEPRVFRDGDPEPGPQVVALVDFEANLWIRNGTLWDYDGGSFSRSWTSLVAEYGPLVACPQAGYYDAAVEADEQWRESAGGYPPD